MPSPLVNSKLPEIAPTIFATISSLAIEHKAINLGQGLPDYPISSELIRLVNKYMKAGQNQYAHMNGLQQLRNVIAEKVYDLYKTNLNAETEITVTPGGTYAIYTALTTVLQPGDEVIVFEPAYDSYIPNIEVNGAIPIIISLAYPDYKINWDLVKKAITSKTKMIMLNSPHNPTGNVLGKQDISALQGIIKDTNIFILSDEVYEHIVFDNALHESVLRYPDLFQRSFIAFSFGKVYHCTGWKIGYCIAPQPMMKEFRKVHQFNCFSCNTPVQYALAVFLKKKDFYLEVAPFLQEKRDLFQSLMKDTRFKNFVSQGTYFQLYSYDKISDESENDFVIRLIKRYGVAAIPVSAFYKKGQNNRVLRFCFAKKQETLEKAVNRLAKL